MTATCFEMDAHAGQMMLFVETAGKNDNGDAPSSDTDVGGGGVQGTHTEMVERAQRAKLPPTAQIEYWSWMRRCEGASMLLWERMWQLRRPVVDMAAGYGIAAGDGIVAVRSSATACSITEGYLAPQAQELDIGARISSIHDLPPEGGGVGVQWIWEDQPRPQRLGNRWQDGIKRGKRMETC